MDKLAKILKSVNQYDMAKQEYRIWWFPALVFFVAYESLDNYFHTH